MQRTSAIQVKAIILTPPMAATMQNVAGQLAPTSRKTYAETICTKMRSISSGLSSKVRIDNLL